MESVFEAAGIGHAAGLRRAGDAAARVIPAAAIDAALAEISGWEGYEPTPAMSLGDLAGRLGIGAVLYKHEGGRFGLGSFKALGGSYAAMRVLAREIARREGREVGLAEVRAGLAGAAAVTLASATDGNHGRAVAWGARRFGARCRIYIHAEVSEARAEAMRTLGAEVIRVDGDYDHSVAVCRDEAAANGWFVVSDTSWPGYSEPPRDVMAGYGVMAREAVAALEAPPTHVFLQGGVGGLAAAVAAGLRQGWGAAAPRVVVVEPDRAACLIASARAGQPVTVAIEAETIMAGLSCGEPSPLAWEVLAEEASDFLTIPDTLIPPTVRLLAQPPGADPAIEAGESGVAGLAGLIAVAGRPDLRAALGIDGASRVLLIGSEGVTDPAIYADIMAGGDGT